MATENPLTLVNSDGGGTQNWSTSSSSLGYGSASGDSSEQDLRLLLRGQKFRSSREMFPNRSGSAPPTFEGSLAALGGILPDDISGLNSPQGNRQNSDEQLKFDSEVTSSYYLQSHPRLHRDWHSVGQRLAGLGDRRKLRSFDDSNSSFLFFSRPLLPTHKEEPEEDRSPRSNLIRQSSSDWAEARSDSIAGLSLPSLGGWPKSLVDRIQEDFPRTPSPVYNLSRSASHPANEEAFDSTSSLDVQQIHLRESTIAPGKSSEVGTGISVSRTGTPNPNPMHILGASSVNNSSIASIASTNIPLEGNQLDSSGDIIGKQITGLGGSDDGNARLESVLLGSVNTSDASEIVDALKNLNMKDVQNLDQYTHQKQQAKEDAERSQSYQIAQIQQRSNLSSRQGQVPIQVSTQPLYQQSHSSVSQTSRNHPKHGSNLLQPSHLGMQPAVQPVGTPHLYPTAATYLPSGNPYLQNMQSAAMFATQYGIGGYPMNATLLSPLMPGYPAPGAMTFAFDNTAAALAASINARSSAAATPAGIGVGVDLQNLYKFGGQFGTTLHPHLTDPMYVHYVQRPAEDSYNVAMLNDPLSGRGFLGGSQVDNSELHKLSMLGYAAEQKPHMSRNGAVGLSMAGKTVPNPAFYGSPSNMGLIMQYPTPSLAPPLSPGSPSMATTNISARFGDRSIRYPLGSSKATVGVYSGWQAQGGNDKLGDMKCSSFLEELKNNRSRRFELSDIAGQVVEFSADQHGSRFIQQKLESASLEEKALVFQEVLPHASKLMTDVFGNYVIQKFFEHGTDQQRKELANQLSSRVLTLSLQMYGCRVVQKALEVVDVDQQMQLVLELNGHVLKCVRDQNGNHVIQKCIECVPTDRIEFIISAFYGQVVTLSTHPYGCRVIQRVLEHCTEEQKNSGIMKEILDSIFNLSEDQYGNYVAQHVLEHGMPHERSEIIKKLSGKIVQMSQHKFASNVVEKCLEYGDPKERELLIDEILGDSQENENLQAMMKDPFANYVVQKVLETCNSEQRDKLLSCIKEHSHALKKYTYGKHIVARAEKMLNSGGLEKQCLQ